MAAELIQRARRDTVRHFQEVGATSAERGVTYQPQRHLERRALGYLTEKQVVRLGDDGRYWLDEEAAEAWRRSNRTKAAILVGGAVATIGIALWLRGRRRKDP